MLNKWVKNKHISTKKIGGGGEKTNPFLGFFKFTVIKRTFLFCLTLLLFSVLATLTVSCGGGGGGAIAATGGNNSGKTFGTGGESGSKIELTSDQLFAGETASMLATETAYEFIRLKVYINNKETVYTIQKSQNIELNLPVTLGDKLQMQAEICDAVGTVVRTAASNQITIGIGKNNVVMYIIYKAKLHHADGTVTEYPFTSLGTTLPVDSSSSPVPGYAFSAWASGFSDGSYDGTNASGVFTNSIAPGTRGDIELYAHWKPAPLDDGTIPPAKARICYYDNPASSTPTNSGLYTPGEGLASLPQGSAARAGSYVAAGATFAGWYPNYDAASGTSGGKVTVIDATQTGTVNLYARWEYNVTLYNNPLDLSDTTVLSYVKENIPTLANASLPAGWSEATFEGWYTTALSSGGLSAKSDGTGYEVSASAVKKTAITPGTDKLYAWFSATATLVYDKCEATGCTELKEEKTFFPGVAYTLPASAAAKTTLTNSTTSALMKYAGWDAAVSCDGWYTTFTSTYTSPVDYSKATFTGSISAIPASQKGDCTVYAKYTVSDVLRKYTLDNYDIFVDSSTGFIVSRSVQMQQLVDLSHSGKNFSGATITLKDNVFIDNESGGFNFFRGTFDGGGYNVTLSNGYALVSTLVGTVKNVKTVGSVTHSRAAIAENCESGSKIESCINEASVTSSSNKVGGICGTLNGGTITGCANTGYITGVTYVGGIVGRSEGGTVENCYNDKGLKGTGDQGTAGICGYVSGRTTFTNCYVTANSRAVRSDDSPVDYWPGSIIGCVSSNYCTISNCYSADPSSDYGGLGRGSSNGSTVTECYKFGAKKSTYANDGTQVFTNWSDLNKAPFNTAPWKWDATKNRPVLDGVGTEGGWGT